MSIRLRLALVGAVLLLPAAALAEDAAPAAPAAPASDAPAAPPAAPPAEPAPPAAETPPVAAAPAAPASMRGPAIVGGVVPPPPAGMANVVFFRPNAFTGSAVWFRVRENGQDLGKLTNGRYFVQIVPAGAHAFSAATEATDTINLETEEGETYYVRATVAMGIMMGRANLAPSDAATFAKDFPKLKLADPAEPAAAAPAG